MTILIANIGTSDLAVKIGDYYIPIGFDRNEPNLDRSGLNEEENTVWKNQQETLATQLCSELGVAVKYDERSKRYNFSFRELTKRLLEEYQKYPEAWHERLRPARILGVVETALKKQVDKAFIFVTNQEPEHFSDSIYLFDILDIWFERQFINPRLKLIKVSISPHISAVNFDGLLNEYYKFFVQPELQESKQILISVKGGTPQMQTALRVQAISSNIANQIYLEPRLSVKKLLTGEGSECQIISYWRYQRLQKYQAVKQLLQRWDFDGARTLLEEWEKTLHSFSENLELGSAPDLLSSQEIIEALIKALNIAVAYLNLDPTFAKENCDFEQLNALQLIVENYPHQPGEENKQYPKLLNLYTQCCIFWNTDRIADFLARIGSFYEETLHELIYAFGGSQYFNRPRERGDWILDTQKLLNNNQALAQRLYKLEQEIGKENRRELRLEFELKRNHCIVENKWNNPLPYPFKLPGRLTKRNFMRALLETHPSLSVEQRNSAIEPMIEKLQSLDYWCLKRNKLIHGAKGISKQRMKDVLKEDRTFYQQKQPKVAWIDYDIKNSIERASEPNHLLEVITEVSRLTLTLMGTSLPRSPMYDQPNYLDSENEPYYIYSDIRDWVQETLDRDL
jgi:hypothetical protein